MDYKKFQQLVREKEKPNVDFKIECHAFISKNETPKAELAKDICAMANNGNIASYIIIGISDDGEKFKSVENDKLTDENIQNFCKLAIYPHPKVKVYKQNWGDQSLPTQKDKEFVILQIGPHAQKAFRLAKDFIDYKENLCYRRNNVWIRRGSTSDLATPEEIAQMVNGQPFESSISETQLQEARQKFSQESQNGRQSLVRTVTVVNFLKKGYSAISADEQIKFYDDERSKPTPYSQYLNLSNHPGSSYFYSLFWKKIDRTLNLIYFVGCRAKLSKADIDDGVKWRGIFPQEPVKWEYINLLFPQLDRQNINAVRRIWWLSVLETVPVNRITSAIPTCKPSSIALHFYMTAFNKWSIRKGRNLIDSSSELIIIQDIKSVDEYNAKFELSFEKLGEIETIIKNE